MKRKFLLGAAAVAIVAGVVLLPSVSAAQAPPMGGGTRT